MRKRVPSSKPRAWVVAVSMGFGHQRTAYPLRHLAPSGTFLNANNYEGIPPHDRKLWEAGRGFYEFISNFKRVPLVGPLAFFLFDQFQKIMDFYPRRDLSAPNFSLRRIFKLIGGGWGKHLVNQLAPQPLPFLSTFFTPAFMAEHFGYPGDIYCIVADADVARAWAPLTPHSSRIQYCAPTERVVERLVQYGVPRERITLTGYPLPRENLGSEKLEVLKRDLRARLLNLDPAGRYRREYASVVEQYLGPLPGASGHPLTIMFSVGGAGAQREIGAALLTALAGDLRGGRVRLIIAAGTKSVVREYFARWVRALGLECYLGKTLEVLTADNVVRYFEMFNEALHTTDILWTKPSELSFYCALGLPLVLAPSIGSQEDFNREWLMELGAAIPQKDVADTMEWVTDLLKAGWFADAAMQGFVEGKKLGTFNIEKLIS
jgi:hypothetical protein